MTALDFVNKTDKHEGTHWSESAEELAIKMEEYAQLKAEQEAIGFVEWILLKGYCYVSPTKNWFIPGEGNLYSTTEELFKLYKDGQ